MDANRIATALDRIADAVNRIERVKAAEGEATLGLRLTQLSARHEKLRREAEAALAALDTVISDAGAVSHG